MVEQESANFEFPGSIPALPSQITISKHTHTTLSVYVCGWRPQTNWTSIKPGCAMPRISLWETPSSLN